MDDWSECTCYGDRRENNSGCALHCIFDKSGSEKIYERNRIHTTTSCLGPTPWIILRQREEMLTYDV
jgi:hypothetical protein